MSQYLSYPEKMFPNVAIRAFLKCSTGILRESCTVSPVLAAKSWTCSSALFGPRVVSGKWNIKRWSLGIQLMDVLIQYIIQSTVCVIHGDQGYTAHTWIRQHRLATIKIVSLTFYIIFIVFFLTNLMPAITKNRFYVQIDLLLLFSRETDNQTKIKNQLKEFTSFGLNVSYWVWHSDDYIVMVFMVEHIKSCNLTCRSIALTSLKKLPKLNHIMQMCCNKKFLGCFILLL